MLPDEVTNLWNDYLRAEEDRIRAIVTERLARFIDRLLQEDTPVWQAWALDTAASAADEGADIQVRFPLFERVLLPALADGVARGAPGCARWLAHFGHLLHHAGVSVLPAHLRTTHGLLQEAVRLDAADLVARRRLVEQQASYLEYTLHELPSGVLYGHDGASVAECDDLLQQLADFREHVAVLRETDRHAALIEECAEHYGAYRDYLQRDRPDGSYARFFERRVKST
jgi:hypothetical protein